MKYKKIKVKAATVGFNGKEIDTIDSGKIIIDSGEINKDTENRKIDGDEPIV